MLRVQQWFSNFHVHQNYLEAYENTEGQASPPEFNSLGLEYGKRIYIPNVFPGDAVAAGSGTPP